MELIIRKRPYKISLTDGEWEIIEFIALQRDRDSKENGFYRELGNREDSLEIGIQAVAAEIAFCKMANIYPFYGAGLLGTGRPDLVIHNYTVDVKSTKAVTNDLMLNTKITRKRDIYTLLAVIRPDAFYLGWGWGVDLIRENRIYTPDSKNGHSRTAFHRLMNYELMYDDFWAHGWTPTEGGWLSVEGDQFPDRDQASGG